MRPQAGDRQRRQRLSAQGRQVGQSAQHEPSTRAAVLYRVERRHAVRCATVHEAQVLAQGALVPRRRPNPRGREHQIARDQRVGLTGHLRGPGLEVPERATTIRKLSLKLRLDSVE